MGKKSGNNNNNKTSSSTTDETTTAAEEKKNTTTTTSDPHKDGTISNTTTTTSAVLSELYQPDDLLDKDDPSLVDTDVDKHKPTDGPTLTLAQKVQNFQRFADAMKDPSNKSAVRPFMIASLSILVLPMLVFHFMLRIVIPLCLFGEIVNMDTAVALNEEVALGMDKITLSGLAALLVSWMVLSGYTLYAFLDNAPKKEASTTEEELAALEKNKVKKFNYVKYCSVRFDRSGATGTGIVVF